MKKRMSRTNEGRKTFKIDSLLDRRLKEDSDLSVTNLGGYMTMTFLGYYDKAVDTSLDRYAGGGIIGCCIESLNHTKGEVGAAPGEAESQKKEGECQPRGVVPWHQ